MTKDMVDDFKLSVMSMKEPHEKMCTMKLMQIGYTWGKLDCLGGKLECFFWGGDVCLLIPYLYHCLGLVRIKLRT